MSDELAKVIPIETLLELSQEPRPIRSDQVLELIAQMIERDAAPVREALAEVIRIGHALHSELPSMLMEAVLGRAEKTSTGMPAKVMESIDRMRKRLRPWASPSPPKDSKITSKKERIDAGPAREDLEKQFQKRLEQAKASLVLAKDKELEALRTDVARLQDALGKSKENVASAEARFESLRREVHEKIVSQQASTQIDLRRAPFDPGQTVLIEALTMISVRRTSGAVKLHRFDEKNRCALCEISATEIMRLRSHRHDARRMGENQNLRHFGVALEDIASSNYSPNERASLLLCAGEPGVVVSVDPDVERQFL